MLVNSDRFRAIFLQLFGGKIKKTKTALETVNKKKELFYMLHYTKEKNVLTVFRVENYLIFIFRM